MANPTYIPMRDAANQIAVIGRVYDSGKSEFIRNDGQGWQPDETGIFWRRWYDSTDEWLPSAEAEPLIQAWGG